MLSNDSHEELEKLCTLAAAGELSEEEQTRWKAHLIECANCRAKSVDFADLVHDKLPMIKPSKSANAQTVFNPAEQRELFLARAQRLGFISPGTSKAAASRHFAFSLNFFRQPKFALAAILMLFVAIGMLSYLVIRTTARNRTLRSELDETRRDKSSLEMQIERLSKSAPTDRLLQRDVVPNPPALKKQTDHNASANRATEEARDDTRDEYESLLSRYKAVEIQLEAATKQLDAMKKDDGARQSSGVDHEAELKATQSSLAKLNDEIKSLRNGRSNDLSTMAAQEAQVRELSDRLREQTEALNRERRLLAADRDIRELMTARNLHIVDVYDVDEKGKTKRTFGRAFYTEGRSLIFYAFDLEDTRITKAKYSLQAWGYQQSTDRSVQSLGIFYVDDQKKNRWALKFDDPAVLAQIDSVFVTIEPLGGSKRPSGEKLLYAYLKNQPNHP
jgi:hypothetical protein